MLVKRIDPDGNLHPTPLGTMYPDRPGELTLALGGPTEADYGHYVQRWPDRGVQRRDVRLRRGTSPTG